MMRRLADGGLIDQVKLGAAGGEHRTVFPGEPPHEGAAHHAAMASDEDPPPGKLERDRAHL